MNYESRTKDTILFKIKLIRLKFSISQSVRKDEEGRKPIKAIIDETRQKELNFCHKVKGFLMPVFRRTLIF